MDPTDVIGADVRLWRGDCRDVLPHLPAGSVGLVLTDPPFGVGLESHSGGECMDGTLRHRVRAAAIAGDDDQTVPLWVVAWADARGLPLCVFGSPYRPYPGEWRNVLVWDKGPAVGGGGDPATCWKRTHELVYVRRNGHLRAGRDEAVLRFPVVTGTDFEHHPCQKPVALLRYLIRQLTAPGDLVLDPCMGSGSTGVAALREGRRFVGCEIDPGHYATALRRLTHAAGAGADQLFSVLGEGRP